MTTLSEQDNVTLALQAEKYIDGNATSFFSIKSYSLFIEIIEKTVQKSIAQLETNPKFLQVGEDQITNILCIALRMAGINADHDSMEGGHADIVIKNIRYKWIAEAKIKDDTYDYAWLWGGFMQLTERYATNTAGCNKAGFFVYVKQPNSKRTMERWKAHMEGKKEEYTFDFFDTPFPFSFGSSHEHTRFGDGCLVTHFCLSAHFAPVV